MPYDETYPADSETVGNLPGAIRQKGSNLKALIDALTGTDISIDDANVSFTASEIQSAIELLNNAENIQFDDANVSFTASEIQTAIESLTAQDSSFDDTNFFTTAPDVEQALQAISEKIAQIKDIELIPASDMITGADLASALGITQGTLINSETPWIRFDSRYTPNGKTLYVPLKPIRYSISWDNIYLAGAVYGDGLLAGESGAEHHNLTSSSGSDLTATRQDASITINDTTYNVRLLRGAADDPTNSFDDGDRGSIGPENEWNALMLPIHERAKTGNWNYSQYAPNDVEDWGVGFSGADLITHYDFGNGSYSWCQETRDTDVSQRVLRGYDGVSTLGAKNSASTASGRGWRPALERA